MYAISIGQLTAFQAVDNIHSIVTILTFLIWLLNATARWGVVVGDGQSYHRSVGHVERALNQALAKRASTNYYSAVLVLYGTSNNLCCRCCVAVNQHYHLAIAHHTAAIGFVLCARHLAAFGIYYQIATLQKLVGYVDGSLKIASAVLLQV